MRTNRKLITSKFNAGGTKPCGLTEIADRSIKRVGIAQILVNLLDVLHWNKAIEIQDLINIFPYFEFIELAEEESNEESKT